MSQTSLNMTESVHSTDVDDDLRSQFKNFEIMSRSELADAIEKCKSLIIEADESSSQRKWLIRKLVDLRYKFAQISALRDDTRHELTISSHVFVKQSSSSKRVYCDFCTNCVWMFMQSYSCVNCFYTAHAKCVKHVTRLCSHVIVSEKGVPEYRICPEIGLSLQQYRCAECSIVFFNKQCFIEPRKCHYSGLYFCNVCHWNNYSMIPANIVHNWDFDEKLVARQSIQEINLFYERPVIKLEELNPKLFVFNPKLGVIKAKRLQLMEMKRYLDVCKFAVKSKLINSAVSGRRYLVDDTVFYSIYDLVCVENNSLAEFLNNIAVTFRKHIAECQICRGHGYICELCGNKEPIFPFNDGVSKCDGCGSCFHRACSTGSLRDCPKCHRIKEKMKITSDTS